MGLRIIDVFTSKSHIVWMLMLCIAVSTEVQPSSVPTIEPYPGYTPTSTSPPNALHENHEPELLHIDQLLSTNISFVDQPASNETELSIQDRNDSLKFLEGKQENVTVCCLHEMITKMAQLHKVTSKPTKMQGSLQGDNESQSLAMFLTNANLRNETNSLFPVSLYSQLVNSSRNVFGIVLNGTDEIIENMTLFELSQTRNIDYNTTTPQSKKVRIWEKGLLKRELLTKILTYFRACMIVPVFFSVISVILTVVVLKDKNFVYQGKPLVISFNIFEGLKSIAVVIFRMVKLYIGDEQITWNSWYAQFFKYYIMWLPISLGRIGFLHNGLITLDRFFTIAFPLRHFNKRLVTRPKTCIAIIVISMVAYQSAPMILFFTEVEPRLDYEKTFRNSEIISEIYLINPPAYGIYVRVLIIGDILFAYIPLLLALIFNILTLISLWRHKQMVQATLKNNTLSTLSTVLSKTPSARVLSKTPSARVLSKTPSARALSKSQTAKRQANNMVVVSSLIFAVLVLFRRLLPLVALFVKDLGEGRREMHLYALLNEIFHFLDCLSPLANIISYISLSSQFSRRVKEILCQSFNTTHLSPSTNVSDNNESN